MDIQIYRLMHVVGLMMVFLGLGGAAMIARGGHGKEYPGRKMPAATHGVGLLLLLVAGFGMLARLGIHWPWPGWVVLKVVLWVFFGGVSALFIKKPQLATPLWWVLVLLGGLAGYAAFFKPF